LHPPLSSQESRGEAKNNSKRHPRSLSFEERGDCGLKNN